LNVTVTAVVTATAVAPFKGEIDDTCNGPVSAVGELEVVNVLANDVTGFPVRSVTPPVATVTVYAVLTASEFDGVNASVVAFTMLTVPATDAAPAFSVIDPGPTLTALTGSLNPSSTDAFTGTPVLPFPGLEDTTTGAVACEDTPVVKQLFTLPD
jgi:hypothetical protein